jgi:myo-inositol-1-phosphate synthase
VVRKGVKIEEPSGKLGVLIPGLGAVSTTFIAGVEAVKKKIAKPIGSLTQMGTIRLGKRTDKRVPAIREFVPLAKIEDLVFGGWDIYNDNCFRVRPTPGSWKISPEAVRPEIEKIVPLKAVFNRSTSRDFRGRTSSPARTRWNCRTGDGRHEKFRKKNNLSRMIMVWCGSTEIFSSPNLPTRPSPPSKKPCATTTTPSLRA